MAKKKGMYTAPVEEDILSPTERRVYDMYSSNYTYTDMSEELGVSYASVRQYMTSARRKLRLSDTDHDIVEDLLLWAPRVSTVLEMKAAQVLIRAAEEIKQLRERVNK
jgi:DNA-binding CsgD family transcriptional regulator